MNTTMIGTLDEIRDASIVLTGPAHMDQAFVMLPPGREPDDLIVGERLMVTATWEGGHWTAECIERYPG